jgi:hypothetical protein
MANVRVNTLFERACTARVHTLQIQCGNVSMTALVGTQSLPEAGGQMPEVLRQNNHREPDGPAGRVAGIRLVNRTRRHATCAMSYLTLTLVV